MNLPRTSLEGQFRTSPGHHFRTSPGRQIGTFQGWSNRTFRGRPGNVRGGGPRDVLGTNICRLGNKSKYSSNSKDIFKSAKIFYETLYTKQTTSKAATTKLLSEIPNRKKISNKQFNFCEAKISLDEIMKSINSQSNNKFLGNDALTAEFRTNFF